MVNRKRSRRKSKNKIAAGWADIRNKAMLAAKKLAKSKKVMTSAQNLIKSKSESGSFDTGHMSELATHSMSALNQS